MAYPKVSGKTTTAAAVAAATNGSTSTTTSLGAVKLLHAASGEKAEVRSENTPVAEGPQPIALP